MRNKEAETIQCITPQLGCGCLVEFLDMELYRCLGPVSVLECLDGECCDEGIRSELPFCRQVADFRSQFWGDFRFVITALYRFEVGTGLPLHWKALERNQIFTARKVVLKNLIQIGFESGIIQTNAKVAPPWFGWERVVAVAAYGLEFFSSFAFHLFLLPDSNLDFNSH